VAEETPPIEVRGLTMMYGSARHHEELSFSVERGEVFVIMGGSGSGKSTLLKHLIGLKPPSQGEILFDGEDFGAADAAARKGCSVAWACSTRTARSGAG
jgi:phospholipid/cholesterol/gamma-HCH transport system ATP-binding protein